MDSQWRYRYAKCTDDEKEKTVRVIISDVVRANYKKGYRDYWIKGHAYTH